jgi:hypothetical protein
VRVCWKWGGYCDVGLYAQLVALGSWWDRRDWKDAENWHGGRCCSALAELICAATGFVEAFLRALGIHAGYTCDTTLKLEDLDRDMLIVAIDEIIALENKGAVRHLYIKARPIFLMQCGSDHTTCYFGGEYAGTKAFLSHVISGSPHHGPRHGT